MSKSLVTFIRNQLKIKGSSEHTGRGAFFMYSNEELNYDDMVNVLRTKLNEWTEKGLVLDSREYVDNNVRRFEVLFNDTFNSSYRLFYTNDHMMNKSKMVGGVGFTLQTTETIK